MPGQRGTTADVVIVGGGVVGSAIAYFLAKEGASVVLFERDDLAAHASGAAAGMIAPICESSGGGPLFEWGVKSLERMPALAAELREASGIDPQWSASGILRVALSDGEASELKAHAEALAEHGVVWLSASAALAREPQLARHVSGALWSPREGHVYSPQLTRAYAMAAVRHGAVLRCGVPVHGLVHDGERVIFRPAKPPMTPQRNYQPG